MGEGGIATVYLAASLLCLALATPGQTLAQDSGTLEAGSRVRVTSPAHSLFRAVGVVLDVSTDTVVVDLDEGQSALPIARSEITTMDVPWVERASVPKASSSGYWGVRLWDSESDLLWDRDEPTYSAAQVGGAFAFLGAIAGGGVGNRIGGSMFTDDWQPIEVSGIELSITPMVGADRMGLRIGFTTRGGRASRSRLDARRAPGVLL